MKIMRLKEVLSVTGLSRSSIYGFIAAGTFPKSVPLGVRAVGWTSDDVEQWLQDRLALRGEEKPSRVAAGVNQNAPRMGCRPNTNIRGNHNG